MDEQKSEVARLLQQIDWEYQSAQLGLNGFACGNARHDFIDQKMENMHRAHEKLIELVGPDDAIALVVQAIDVPKNQSQQIGAGSQEQAM